LERNARQAHRPTAGDDEGVKFYILGLPPFRDWVAPELDLGDGRRLVLDAPDPFPEEEWALSGEN